MVRHFDDVGERKREEMNERGEVAGISMAIVLRRIGPTQVRCRRIGCPSVQRSEKIMQRTVSWTTVCGCIGDPVDVQPTVMQHYPLNSSRERVAWFTFTLTRRDPRRRKDQQQQ